jgi:hypothetical protein
MSPTPPACHTQHNTQTDFIALLPLDLRDEFGRVVRRRVASGASAEQVLTDVRAWLRWAVPEIEDEPQRRRAEHLLTALTDHEPAARAYITSIIAEVGS